MSRKLGDAVYRALTRGRSPATEARSLPGQLAELERAAGGRAAAARWVGVHPSTWRRWRAGVTSPSAGSQALVLAGIRRARLSPGRESRIRGAGVDGVRLDATQQTRHRSLTQGNLRLAPDTVDQVVTAFLAGAAPRDLGGQFKAGIGDPWYRDRFPDDPWEAEIADLEGYEFDAPVVQFGL